MNNHFLTLSLFFGALIAGIVSCGQKSGSFYAASLGLENDRVIIASQIANVLTVSMYDLDGNYLQTLADYQAEGNGPRGLVQLDPTNIIVSLEGDDRLDIITLGGTKSNYLQSSFLSGTIGKLILNPAGTEFFIIEATNMIERFSTSGQRLPVTGNPFVNGALAPCAAPASLRAMAFNNSGNLVAVQSGTTGGFIYTVGATVAASCVATTALSSAANDLINHSNGNMYYAGTNNQIYRASQTLTGSTSIFNNSATIASPTAMAELPNGDLIIASDTTDSLEVIGVDGTYRGTFHKGVHTQQVHSILVVHGQ